MFYHSYLLMTNQTTWENTRERHIDYLNVYPDRYLPFDNGVLNNLEECCFPPTTEFRRWDLPDVEASWKEPKPTTLLNNCCVNTLI